MKNLMDSLRQISSHKYSFAIFVFFAAFLVYLSTLNPVIEWEDSVEFTVAASTLGISHPTGYPTYTMIGHLFTYLPIGPVGFRVNLMSAFFAALAVSMIYLIIRKTTKENILSGLLALVFGFSMRFWSQAVIAEVHSLQIFLLALSLYLLILWRENHQKSYLYGCFFVYGISLTNHVTAVLLLPGYLVLAYKKEHINTRTIFISGFFFLLALLPYIYLPLRSSMQPILDWGDPETFSRFIIHVTGRQYSSRMFDVPVILSSALFFLKEIVRQFYVLLIFAFFGAYDFIKEKKLKGSLPYVLLAFPLLLYSMTYRIGTGSKGIGVFFLPSYFFLILLIAYGIFKVNRKFPAVRKIVFLFLLVSISISLLTNYSVNDQSKNYSSYWYGLDVEKTIGTNEKAVLFTDWDVTLPVFWYLKHVDGKFKDIEIIHKRALGLDWYDEGLQEDYGVLFSSSVNQTLIYHDLIDHFSKSDYLLYSTFNDVEISNKVYNRDGILFSIDEIKKPTRMHRYQYILAKKFSDLYEEDEIEDQIRPKYANYFIFLGIEVMEKEEYSQAAMFFKKATAIFPLSFEAWNNLGIAYYSDGAIDLAVWAWKNALEIRQDAELEKNLVLLGKHENKKTLD